MKESVHNVSTEKLHVNFKAVNSRATSSLISPFFLLSAACTRIEEHDCYISIRLVQSATWKKVQDIWLAGKRIIEKCKNYMETISWK